MNKCLNHNVCVNDALEKANMICEQKKIRLTDLRLKVLKMIWNGGHKPVKAYDIIDNLKDGNKSCKPPTVYRTLDFLIENGLVHKLNSVNAYVGCCEPLHETQCYFIICNKCGEINEYFNKNIFDEINQSLKENKFISKNTILEIEGLCELCH